MNQVVTGYRWTDDAGLVPVWGPPALTSPVKPNVPKVGRKKPEVNKNGEPKPDKVITQWKMPGRIFRLKAHMPQPDGRLIVVYSNGFDDAMKLLAKEARSDLPYRILIDYDGTKVSLWRKDYKDSDPKMWDNYAVCCRDLADRVKRRYDAGEFDRKVEVCT